MSLSQSMNWQGQVNPPVRALLNCGLPFASRFAAARSQQRLTESFFLAGPEASGTQ